MYVHSAQQFARAVPTACSSTRHQCIELRRHICAEPNGKRAAPPKNGRQAWFRWFSTAVFSSCCFCFVATQALHRYREHGQGCGTPTHILLSAIGGGSERRDIDCLGLCGSIDRCLVVRTPRERPSLVAGGRGTPHTSHHHQPASNTGSATHHARSWTIL